MKFDLLVCLFFLFCILSVYCNELEPLTEETNQSLDDENAPNRVEDILPIDTTQNQQPLVEELDTRSDQILVSDEINNNKIQSESQNNNVNEDVESLSFDETNEAKKAIEDQQSIPNMTEEPIQEQVESSMIPTPDMSEETTVNEPIVESSVDEIPETNSVNTILTNEEETIVEAPEEEVIAEQPIVEEVKSNEDSTNEEPIANEIITKEEIIVIEEPVETIPNPTSVEEPLSPLENDNRMESSAPSPSPRQIQTKPNLVCKFVTSSLPQICQFKKRLQSHLQPHVNHIKELILPKLLPPLHAFQEKVNPYFHQTKVILSSYCKQTQQILQQIMDFFFQLSSKIKSLRLKLKI